MKVFTAQQMRDFDQRAVNEYSIPSIVLMENAALRVVEFLEWKFAPLQGKSVIVLCGKGNNGGDGFAIARHLASAGCFVKVLRLYAKEELSGDALTNYQVIEQDEENGPDYFHLGISAVDDLTCSSFVGNPDICIDAWLGTGFSGHLEGTAAELLPNNNIVSVDIPSGLDSQTGESSFKAIRANYTITFAAPKRGMFLRNGTENCGEVWVGEIGTAHNQMKATETSCEAITREFAHSLLPQRPVDAHKGTAGKVVVIGGSRGMSGAPALASLAALRVGAGLCIAAVPERVLDVFASNILEATSRPLPCDDAGRLIGSAADALPDILSGADAVALGPGLSRSEGALNFARRVVRECDLPLIVDADALYSLRAIVDDVKLRKAPTILTPHPGEMAELMETDAQTVNDNRLETAVACAQKYNAIVILKGARSVIATPDGKTWFNLTGNAGMATGGSGDVLTGTIVGLLTPLKSALDAALLGVYLHGLAGDIEYSIKGNGLIAHDIANALPDAILDLQNRPTAQAINGRLRKLE